MEKIGFIIGNGKSRTCFDLLKLRNVGTVYGCNALYRDFAPNYLLPSYLIAIDPWMIEEIQKSSFPKHRFIIPPLSEHWEPFEISPYQRRSNAGINAMLESIRGGCKHLYCLGFDFLITNYNTAKQNVYENTQHYNSPPTDQDNVGRIRHLDYTLKKNPNITFTFVFPENTNIRLPVNNKNLHALSYHHFESILPPPFKVSYGAEFSDFDNLPELKEVENPYRKVRKVVPYRRAPQQFKYNTGVNK